jgi:hypothetical protein
MPVVVIIIVFPAAIGVAVAGVESGAVEIEAALRACSG